MTQNGEMLNPWRILCFVAALLAADVAFAKNGVKLMQLDDKVRVEIGGKLFTEYYFKDVPRPYCYPLLGPGELPMTRHWPLETIPNEEHDHPHHRSLWFAHGAVNGVDFWSEQKEFGKTVHKKFLAVKSGKKSGSIKSLNDWVTRDGKVVCTDERTLRFYDRPGNERMFDFEITIKAPKDQPVVFGDTKEGSMAARLAETMRLTQPKSKPGEGHIVLSTGLRDKETWGKRADWCDYYGPVAGQIVGMAMFDHPENPRHPTWWHVRDYGLLAANPFGIHEFEKKAAGAGNLTIEAGKSVTFRYRFYLHEGDTQQAGIAALYQEYAKQK